MARGAVGRRTGRAGGGRRRQDPPEARVCAALHGRVRHAVRLARRRRRVLHRTQARGGRAPAAAAAAPAADGGRRRCWSAARRGGAGDGGAADARALKARAAAAPEPGALHGHANRAPHPPAPERRGRAFRRGALRGQAHPQGLRAQQHEQPLAHRRRGSDGGGAVDGRRRGRGGGGGAVPVPHVGGPARPGARPRSEGYPIRQPALHRQLRLSPTQRLLLRGR
mmetsp:Transcript_32775/g.83737  ORF Transcript_32775/g.83737 Transcript_32775/m.83737 type:complete len:224 (-) Transcript_32775:515-1186(-)